MNLTQWLKRNMMLVILVLMIGGSALYFLVIHPKRRVSQAPELMDARVVLKVKDLDYATDEFMVVTPDDEPELQAVVIARKPGDTEVTYCSPSAKLKIDGEMVPENRIEQWDTFKWHELRFLWFKIEPRIKPRLKHEPFDYAAIEYKYQYQHDWPMKWTHVLDCTGFTNSYPRQNVGIMRFKVRAEIKTSTVNVVQKAISKGEDCVDQQNIICPDVFMAQMAPSRDLFGYTASLFNLAFSWDLDWAAFADNSPLTNHIAINGAAYFTEGARLAGFEGIPTGDMAALRERIQPVLENVRLDEEKGQYVNAAGEPIEVKDLQKGMFIVQGDKVAMFAGEGSFELGKLRFLTPDDRVLYSPELPLYFEKIGNYFERPFMIGELQ